MRYVRDVEVAGSNPVIPTNKNTVFDNENRVFSKLKVDVAFKIGKIKRTKRKPLINEAGYPYHPAELVSFDNSLSKKWYIIYYAFDIGKRMLVRKRLGKELNAIVNLNERRRAFEAEIRTLNDNLKTGGYLETDKKEKEQASAFNFHGYKLLSAFDYVHNYKRELRKENTAR